MTTARKIGYARVSTTDQSCAIQEAALKAAGCDLVFHEEKSGTSTAGREQLELAMKVVRKGDTLIVTRIDRLARSNADLYQIAERLKEKGVTLRATEQAFDTGTPEGKALFGMLGVFAEFETAIRHERQMEGITKAKAIPGKYKGRPEKKDRNAEIAAMLTDKVPWSRIKTEKNVALSTIARVAARMKKEAGEAGNGERAAATAAAA
jgi:DNA invertase Pin-like site-specific DNA recombinase